MDAEQDALAVAVTIAREAGELQLSRRDRLVVKGVKAHVNDLVSDVDLASEKLIVARLHDAFPEDGVLGEEGADRAGTSGRRWVIDPIDGTRNFVSRSGPWSVCLALREVGGGEETTTVAVIHDPVAGETFTAVAGHGARLGEAALHASSETSLDRAILALTFNAAPATRVRVGLLMPDLMRIVGDLRRYPGSLQLAYLAAGRVDVGLLVDTQPWDVAAGHLIAAEAGVWLTGPGGVPSAGLTLSAAPGLREEFDRRIVPVVTPA